MKEFQKTNFTLNDIIRNIILLFACIVIPGMTSNSLTAQEDHADGKHFHQQAYKDLHKISLKIK